MPRHHLRFYFPEESDPVVLQLEDYLFRVGRSRLSSVSEVFTDMFALPQDPSNVEGQSDAHPIYLSSVPIPEFEQILAHIYADDTQAKATSRDLLVRMAAAARWEAPAVQVSTMQQLAAMDDPIIQLIVARRYDLEAWMWPALFAACMRSNKLTVEETLALGGADSDLIKRVRIALDGTADILKGQHVLARIQNKPKPVEYTSVYKKEDRLRQLLHTLAQIPEPLVSDLRPPVSGYRLRITSGEAFPYHLAGETQFSDLGGEPVYIGSAVVTHRRDSAVRAIVPCKVTPRIRPDHHIAWNGKETWGHLFELLPFDSQRMEWIETSGGEIPEGRSPVRGGYDADDTPLFHACGMIPNHSITCPGKTSKKMGGASLPFAGGEHIVREGYHILVWKQ
jgi:hypothetical protein